MSLLRVENLTMRFGGLLAVDKVCFTAQPQAITSIIGPNGAGKTTLFNCLTGFYRPTSGHIFLEHHQASFALETMARAAIPRQARVARTFQNIRLFAGMTVLENLLVASNARHSYFFTDFIHTAGAKHRLEQAIQKALIWLDFFGLRHTANTTAGSLSYGQQRKIEIARALCTDPVLLCLDEPAAGLNAAESAELMHRLAALPRERGIALLLIEHDMGMVMGISDHIVVLEYGRKIAEGNPAHIRHHPEVIRAYLGEGNEE